MSREALVAKELYTIGHSNHPINHFIDLLAIHHIEVICDVRSAPYSRYNPQFNREPLRQALKQSEIGYVFLGKELGARTDDPACYVDGKISYHRLSQTPVFQIGIARLEAGIDRYRVALLCAEKDPVMCHRSILICHQLRSSNFEIKHILDDGAVEQHRQLEQRLMRVVGVQQDLFSEPEDLIEEAYVRQASRIAYDAGSRSMPQVAAEIKV
jgi:uncharacterized protein (DUF488 family)